MRFFLRSRQFRIIVSVVLAVILVTASFTLIAKRTSPQTDLVSTVTAPIRTAVGSIASAVNDFLSNYNNSNKLSLENNDLKSQIAELQNKIADYDEIVVQNEFYKDYLEIKEKHSDYQFTDVNVISRDSDDPYGSFVVNKGSNADISLYDPVITDSGVVGYVTEIGLTTCKVTTILSPEITLGALDNRTNDSGIVTGSLTMAQKGFCRFANLSRSCTVAVGDYVVTSGEGIFPEGLLVGTVENIGADEYNTSIYAEVKPFADIEQLRSVMIITSFEGQGGITVNNGGNGND